MMNFVFFDLVEVTVDDSLPGLCSFLQREFEIFIRPEPGSRPYRIEFVRGEANDAPSTDSVNASVADLLFRSGDRYRISDGRGNSADWFQAAPDADTVTLEVEPSFTPYRVYYYLLLPLLKRFLNRHGMTFLHSSAVDLGDARVALSGWGGTGKTNTLLGLLELDGVYLGDDLILIDEHGSIFPFPRSVNVYHYNVEAVPRLRGMLSRSQWMRARFATWLGNVASGIAPRAAYLISVIQKRVSNTYVPSRFLKTPAAARGARASLLVLLVRSEGVGFSDAFRSKECIANACVVNITQEFQPVQNFCWMYAFLSGSKPEQVVTGRDEEIIRGFLAHTRAEVLPIQSGSRAESVIVDMVGKRPAAGARGRPAEG